MTDAAKVDQEPAETGEAAQRISYTDLLKTGPGTIAGRYMRSFWQPVFLCADLEPGKARRIQIMSEYFTLYRGEGGAAHLVADRCAHRGVQLSIGYVEGEAIRCPYHGWKYDASGQCIEQPSEPKQFCDIIRVRSYPVKEYCGMIFAYLGEGEPPAVPHLPEFEDGAGYIQLVDIDTWNSNYFAQLENSMDYSHTEIVHWQFYYKTPDSVAIEETAFGATLSTPGLSGVAAYYDTGHYHMPNAHEWAAPPRRGESIGNYARGWRVPVDDETHLRFNLSIVPLKGDAAKGYMERVGKTWTERTINIQQVSNEILGGEREFKSLRNQQQIVESDLINVQDCTVMGSLYPMSTREPEENLGRTDVGVILIRRLWQKELRKLAKGQPLTQWDRPDYLWDLMKADA